MSVAVLPEVVTPGDGLWPPPPGASVVLLAQAIGSVEHGLVDALAQRLRGDGMQVTVVRDGAAAIAAGRDSDSDASIAPVRVVWLADDALADVSAARLARDVARTISPPQLLARRQRRALARSPERCRVVIGQPASVGELEARWSERSVSGDDSGLASFVERQADIVLERAERRLTGERYRSAQGVAQELATSREFTEGAQQLAGRIGREPAGVLADAEAYLAEMATDQQQLARDVWTTWAKFTYSRAYTLDVDPAQLESLRELAAKHPLVFLPTHRSNLDGYVMISLLHENGFPPNHTLGGINMAFWPLGPIGRRVGVIWIRRTFRDNEVYKYALGRYLGYMVSKRFNLEWYIEGGRSRTGKLLPPKLGLFNYLADAVEERGLDDVRVVPVSIVYDELQEAAEMTTESHGDEKKAEGLGWLLHFARQQRGEFGAVHVSFGEPLDLAASLRANGSSADAETPVRRLARSKAAFEVCTRINRATPVTPTSLVTLALLGVGDRALTVGEVVDVLEPVLRYVAARGLPTTEDTARLGTPAGVRETLHTLVAHGVVEDFAEGPQPVYRIGPDQELVAAYYRNMAIHWFVNRAIVELALLRAAESPAEDGIDVAIDEALALRDLLKFEFFFAEKDAFREELKAETDLLDRDWREPGRLAEIGTMLSDSGALMAHRILRSFLEAYAIAADHLASLGDAPTDADDAAKAALPLGRQYRLQRRVHGAEAISTHLFRSAYKLAANRDLLDAGPDLAARRAAFAEELTDVLRRMREIDELARVQTVPV